MPMGKFASQQIVMIFRGNVILKSRFARAGGTTIKVGRLKAEKS